VITRQRSLIQPQNCQNAPNIGPRSGQCISNSGAQHCSAVELGGGTENLHLHDQRVKGKLGKLSFLPAFVGSLFGLLLALENERVSYSAETSSCLHTIRHYNPNHRVRALRGRCLLVLSVEYVCTKLFAAF
jgi:hypothetical protein